MNKTLKQKWGGSFPQVGDWVTNPNYTDQRILILEGHSLATFRRGAVPIPLTREVLERIKEAGPVYIPQPSFGEESIESRFCGLDGKYLFKIRIYPNQESHLIIGDWGLENIYLHQLQQMYRLLTCGQELTYSPAE